MDQRTCKGCGKPLPPKGPRERNPRKWCNQSCRVAAWARLNPDKVAAQVLRADQKRRAQAEAAKTPCEVCGKPAGKVGGRTCGQPGCLAEMNRRRVRSHYAADREAKRQKVAEYRASRSQDQLEHDRARRRAWKESGGRDALRSADSRRRARKFAAPVEKFTHREIFERDGWRCGICGRRINRKLKSPDPGSASLDHVIPLSLGGSHTRANVRASHLDCNVARGAARFGADQLALL